MIFDSFAAQTANAAAAESTARKSAPALDWSDLADFVAFAAGFDRAEEVTATVDAAAASTYCAPGTGNYGPGDA